MSLPLVNDVQAAGLTPMDLRQHLTKQLAEYLPSPEVSVIVREVHNFKVAVVGSVKMPGDYEIKSQATVLELIARAQGLTEFANRDSIVVLAPERLDDRRASRSTTARSPKATTRTTSMSAPATSSSFRRRGFQWPVTCSHPTADDSLALRALDILRRRRTARRRRLRGRGCRGRCPFALYLPDLYRAQALVLVERPVDESFVRAVRCSGELESRLHIIKQEILSRDRLMTLITRFNLYPELRRRGRSRMRSTRCAATSRSIRPDPNRSAAGPRRCRSR